MKPIPLIHDVSRTAPGTLCCDPSQLSVLFQDRQQDTPRVYGTFVLLEKLNDTSDPSSVFVALDDQTIFIPGEGTVHSVNLTGQAAFLIPFSEYRQRAGNHPGLEGLDPYDDILASSDAAATSGSALVTALRDLRPVPTRQELIAQGLLAEPGDQLTAQRTLLHTRQELLNQLSDLDTLIFRHLPGVHAAHELTQTYERQSGLTLDLFDDQGQLLSRPQTLMGRMVAASIQRHLTDPEAATRVREDLKRQAECLTEVVASGRLDQFAAQWASDPQLIGLPVHEALLEESEMISDTEWQWSDDLMDMIKELNLLAVGA